MALLRLFLQPRKPRVFVKQQDFIVRHWITIGYAYLSAIRDVFPFIEMLSPGSLVRVEKDGSEQNVNKKPTKRQGQYLAFIYYHTNINRRPPAEANIQCHFRVTPPTVHQAILTLEKNNFISRIPGQPRSIQTDPA